MYICPDCGKELKAKGTHWVRHCSERQEEFRSYTVKALEASLRKTKGQKRPDLSKALMGHKPTFSRESLGDRYDEINAKRSLKISQNTNIEGCRMAQARTVEVRKQNGTYKWSKDAPGRKSPKYKGRKPWNIGLTKHTSLSLKAMGIKLRKDPSRLQHDIDWTVYGWTKEKAQEIRKRDYFTCQMCGQKRVTIVHHKDMDRRNNSNSNLITLCRACHQEVHMKRNSKGQFEFRKAPLQVISI